MAIGLALEITMRIAMLMIGVLLRKKITRKFRLEDLKFDGYSDPHVFRIG